jgi:hypothetical protein
MVSKCIADGDTEYLLSLEPTKLASCCDVRRAILRKGDYESLIAKFTTMATECLVTVDDGVLRLTSNGEEHVLGRGIVDVLLSMLELVAKGTIDVPSQSVHSRPEEASAAWESFCAEWRYSKDFLALRDVGDIVQVVKNGWA